MDWARFLWPCIVICIIASIFKVPYAESSGATPCFHKRAEAGRHVADAMKKYRTNPLPTENACKIVEAYDIGLEKLQEAERVCIRQYRKDVSRQGYLDYSKSYGVYLSYNEMIKSRANYAKQCPSAVPVSSWSPASVVDVEKRVFSENETPKEIDIQEENGGLIFIQK